jgi:hypothetical protein
MKGRWALLVADVLGRRRRAEILAVFDQSWVSTVVFAWRGGREVSDLGGLAASARPVHGDCIHMKPNAPFGIEMWNTLRPLVGVNASNCNHIADGAKLSVDSSRWSR